MTNFFISYNQADHTWAEWIAWQLEEAGYTTILQAWDFRPSENFPIKINEAIRESERLVAVLSPDYVSSNFGAAEWAAAFAQDPKGEKGILLPVRVRECDLKGLFNGIIHVDLVGKDEAEARKALLDGILRGRAKPLTKPAFPRTNERRIAEHPSFPGPRARTFSARSLGALLIVLAVLLTGVVAFWLRYLSPVEPPRSCPKSATGHALYYEAEDAELWGSASKDSEHLGFSGNGYVSGYGTDPEAFTTFSVEVPSAGQYQLDLCYANATRAAKLLSIYVNEERVKQTRLPNASQWDSWLIQSETVPLRAGRNAISYRKTTGDSGEVNLDFLGVLQKPIVAPTPSPTPSPTSRPLPVVSPSPSPSATATPTPGNAEPFEDEMKKAVLREFIKRGGQQTDPNTVVFNFVIGSMTVRVNKFVKLGCKPAGYGVGYECTYMMNISNVLHSEDPGIQERLNFLNKIAPPGENTLTKKFVRGDEGWIVFQEQG